MATTPIHKWPTPELTGTANVPQDMRNLANQIDRQVPHVCTSNTRPSPIAGLIIYETNTTRTWIGDGSRWLILGQDMVRFSPTWTGFAKMGTGSKSWGQYSIGPGGMVTLQMRLTAGTGASMGTARLGVASFPVAASSINLQSFGVCSFLHTGPSGLLRTGILTMGGTGTSAEIFVSAGASPVQTPGQAGVPWGNGSQIHAHITYASNLGKSVAA